MKVRSDCVSALMTQDLVREAMELARPSIHKLLEIADRAQPVFVCFVVLSPFDRDGYEDGFGGLHEGIIGELAGDTVSRADLYRGIAHSKAVIARRMQMDTGAVGAICPALFEAGDTHYEGGVCLAGVPVGTSGVESFFDEAISRIIASTINALIKRELRKRRESKEPFL